MNLLQDFGYKQSAIEKKLSDVWKSLFEGSARERVYFEDSDGAYILDTDSDEVSTAGMSWGMLVAVQMNRKDVFDKLWKWARTFMYISSGELKGFFSFACEKDGSVKHELPRPDGEENFALSLIFAGHRWGNGTGIFNYDKEGHAILKAMVHSRHALFNKMNYLVRNKVDENNSDVSYNLPHFYDMFSMFCDPKDEQFWSKAAEASRGFIVRASDRKTGMSAEYVDYSGAPLSVKEHGTYFSHSYVVAANMGLHALWSGDFSEFSAIARNLISFFDKTETGDFMDYLIDGTARARKARYQLALASGVAAAAITLERSKEPVKPADLAKAKRAVKRFWNAPLTTGKKRFFDNSLYFYVLLMLSGNFNVY